MNDAEGREDRVRSTAGRDLVGFLLLVAALSTPWYVVIARTRALEDVTGLVWVAGLMWMPALASVIVRLTTRQGFTDVSFRRALGPRWLLLLPFVVATPAYVFALLLGVVEPDVQPTGQVIALVVVSTVANLILVPGEELGWRGFMVTRLVDAGVPHPLVAGGLIWGAWHIPLVIWGGYVQHGPATWISVLAMMVLTTLLGYVLGAVRLTTGSVWPPVLFHVAWNVVFQAIFEANVTGPDEGLWVGEFGVLTLLFVGIAVVAWARPSLTPVPSLPTMEPTRRSRDGVEP